MYANLQIPMGNSDDDDEEEEQDVDEEGSEREEDEVMLIEENEDHNEALGYAVDGPVADISHSRT